MRETYLPGVITNMLFSYVCQNLAVYNENHISIYGRKEEALMYVLVLYRHTSVHNNHCLCGMRAQPEGSISAENHFIQNAGHIVTAERVFILAP